MRVRNLIALGYLFLSACGIESTVPSDASSPSVMERAVTISSVLRTGTGTIITCELNDAIVEPGTSIPIFLEYQGTEVQRTTLENQATFTFNEYNPPSDGDVVCVVEFANAEFESETMTLTRVAPPAP